MLHTPNNGYNSFFTHKRIKSLSTRFLIKTNFLKKAPHLRLVHKDLKPTFFKFVKSRSLNTFPLISYSTLLLTNVTHESTCSTRLLEHIPLTCDKFSLQNLHKAFVTNKFHEFTPSLKLCIAGARDCGYYVFSQDLNLSQARYNSDTSSGVVSSSNPVISQIFGHRAGHTPLWIRNWQLATSCSQSDWVSSVGLSILALKLHLDFRQSLKLINIRRRKSLKRYYTFYSHYVQTVRDKRSYRRVMLPKFTDSRRGSFWTLPEQTLKPSSLARQQPLNVLKSTLCNNFPFPGNSQAAILPPKPSRSVITFRTSVPSLFTNTQSKNRPTLKSQVRRFRKIRRKLRKSLRRFRRFHVYIRRRFKRHLRTVKRSTYRFVRLKTRREKKLNFKASRKFLRRNYFKFIRRRIRRILSRRFRFFNKRTVRTHYLNRTSYTNLRRAVRAFYKLNVTLSRSSIHRLSSASDRTLDSLVSNIQDLSIQHKISEFPRPTAQTNFNLDSMFMFKHQPLLTNLSPFKYLFSNRTLIHPNQHYSVRNLILRVQQHIRAYSSSYTLCRLDRSNLWSINQSNYSIRRKFLRLIASSSFSADLSFWYYKTLIQFIENCSGRKTVLYFGPFIENALTFEDRARCTLWNNRVTGFQRIMGHRIFVYEALSIVAISIRLKDPTFLANWIRGMLKRLSFWRYRLIFRYLKFMLRYIFQPNFQLFDFRGVKLSLKGKISVAGNARTRTLFMRFGDTSHSKMDNKVAYDLSLVNTFTGVLGFKLLFYY